MPDVILTSGLAATPPVDTPGGVFNWQWLRWLGGLSTQIASNPSRVTTVASGPSSASIPTTAIGAAPLAAGLYRITGYLRVTTAALTTSSVAVALGWSDGGVTCAGPLIAAVTGNTTASTGTGTATVRIDASTPITYNTVYASNGAGEMVYALDLVLEAMGSA